MEEPQPETHKKVKVCFLGPAGTGKTQLINQFIDNTFSEVYDATIGVDFRSINYKECKLQIWDTAGQERFQSLLPAYCKDSRFQIFVYDITSKKSFTDLNKLIGIADQVTEEGSGERILIGNKSDLESKREVPYAEAQEFAAKKGMFFLEISTKNFDREKFWSLFDEVLTKLSF